LQASNLNGMPGTDVGGFVHRRRFLRTNAVALAQSPLPLARPAMVALRVFVFVAEVVHQVYDGADIHPFSLAAPEAKMVASEKVGVQLDHFDSAARLFQPLVLPVEELVDVREFVRHHAGDGESSPAPAIVFAKLAENQVLPEKDGAAGAGDGGVAQGHGAVGMVRWSMNDAKARVNAEIPGDPVRRCRQLPIQDTVAGAALHLDPFAVEDLRQPTKFAANHQRFPTGEGRGRHHPGDGSTQRAEHQRTPAARAPPS
jgi:hypothetical protein